MFVLPRACVVRKPAINGHIFKQCFCDITSYAIDFAEPMGFLNIFNSIDNNQNIVWDKEVYLPINETRSYGIDDNVHIPKLSLSIH